MRCTASKLSKLAAAGIPILAPVLTAIGPKRVMAALGYTPVRDVDNGARQPFVRSFSVHMDPFFSSVHPTIASVPPNKRLVIESISVQDAEAPAGERFVISLTTTGSGFSAGYAVP